MAKERTVRGKQRLELDAKASSAATSLSLLKGQLASTEELLESCREDAKMVLYDFLFLQFTLCVYA